MCHVNNYNFNCGKEQPAGASMINVRKGGRSQHWEVAGGGNFWVPTGWGQSFFRIVLSLLVPAALLLVRLSLSSLMGYLACVGCSVKCWYFSRG